MSDVNTVELEPCPFCGGKADMSKDYDPDGSGAFYAIKCRKCRAKSSELYAVEACPIFFGQVRDAWNTRTIAALPPAVPDTTPDPVAEAAKVLLAYMPNYAMERAALESRARDDEGEFPPLTDLLDFSGQNKSYTVIREALGAALRALTKDGEAG